jgi:FkbM family methyltransferase
MLNLLLRLLKKTKLLNYVNFLVKTKVNGRSVRIPIKGSMGFENVFLVEAWFSNLINILTRDFENKDIFVDVGVNVGQTMLKVKSVRSDLNYIGFEPNSACVYYVNELIRVNEFEGVSIYPVGLGGENGIVKLYADNVYASGATVIKNFRKKGKEIKYELNIVVYKGDEFLLNKDSNIKVIKIDVEGFESEVLAGMIGTIQLHRPVIICEVLPVYDKNNSERFERQIKLQEILKANGYNVYLINEEKSKIQLIDEIGIHGDMSKTNYVFCHSDSVERIKELID